MEVKKEVETNWGLTIKKIKPDSGAVTEHYDLKSEFKPQVTKLNFRLTNQVEESSNSKKRRNGSKHKKRCNSKINFQPVNVKITNVRQVESEIKQVVAKKLLRKAAPPKPVKRKVPLKVAVKPTSDIQDNEVIKTAFELDKHRYNIRMIMHYSNATPIRTHYVGNGYACCFCDQFFPKAADLKTHTINDHDKREKMKFMKKAFLATFVVKLDITNLSCNLCKTELDTLEDFTTHLKEKHNKSLYTDIKSQTICFRLDNEELKCMFCQLQCSSFKRLLEHMNQHYRNWVCDICDAGFVTQRMLGTHADGHKKGVFECDVCKKMFDKLRSLKYHLRTTHSGLNRHKCFQCHEKFSTVKMKRDHMIEVHGAQFAKVPCLACDKIFRDKNALRIHTQRDHLMERRYPCTDCDKTFFSNGLLKNHMVMHSGVREFKCELCGRDFARKKTLQTHMRTHKEEPKFICQICQKIFYTQASLDCHAETHGSIRSLGCEECSLIFDSIASLQHHMVVVHGEIAIE